METLVLESDRLILQLLSLEFADVIFQEFTAAVTRYMYPRPAETIRETRRFIHSSDRLWQDGKELTLTILHKATGEFLGVCALHRIDTPTPEIGIWIKQSAHGHRYGREAVHRLKAWADDQLDYTYLVYPVDKRNIASRKIPESLGGAIASEFQKINQSGELLDEVEYHIYR